MSSSPPAVRSRPGLVVAAMVIDALGSGLFGPFVLLYGHVVVGLSLTTTGLAASLASALGLAAGAVAGSAVDRFGATAVVVAGNATAAVGSVGLLFARGPVSFVAASLVCVAAQRAFWAAFAPLVSDTVPVADRERWFGRIRAARYVGMTGGGALAGVVLLLGERTGLRLMVVADAASYAAAAALILASAGWRARPSGRAAGPDSGAQPARGRAAAGGYRAVLADPGNVWLAVLNVASTLMCTAPIMAMPIYVLDHLHRPAWVPGLLAAISAAALAGAVLISHRFTGGHGRLAVLAVANVLWAGACLTFAVAGGVPASALGLLVAGVLLLGVAEAAYAPTADTLPLAIAPPALTGRYSALHQLSWGVSSIIAPIFTATLLAAGAAAVWLALAAVSALAAVAYAAAPRGLRHRAGRAGAATA